MEDSSLISAVEAVLEQGCSLLRGIRNGVFTQREDGPFDSSIGAHYRHVLDHFQCLLEGVRSGTINYDQRRRSPELESSAEVALHATEQLLQQFRALSADTLQQGCTVTYSVGYGESEGCAVGSNVARELMFCVGHAIHHYAILKLLCAKLSLSLPYEFGVAPSTLKHLEAAAAHGA
jgi:uncharacterized damage-inducible protein DinB